MLVFNAVGQYRLPLGRQFFDIHPVLTLRDLSSSVSSVAKFINVFLTRRSCAYRYDMICLLLMHM